jgi:hypothetical protein
MPSVTENNCVWHRAQIKRKPAPVSKSSFHRLLDLPPTLRPVGILLRFKCGNLFSVMQQNSIMDTKCFKTVSCGPACFGTYYSLTLVCKAGFCFFMGLEFIQCLPGLRAR